MQLNHFADPFQNGHASVDQFFDQSNKLTENYDNQTVGYGFAQNPAGYEWSGSGPNDSQSTAMAHSHEYKGNGGYHGQPGVSGTNSCSSGGCGADPHALARANMQAERFDGSGMTREQLAAHHAQARGQAEAETETAEEFIYSGPDDLDYDDETVAPAGGVPFWQRRLPTLIIHGATILFWIWLWSSIGLSKMLTGTVGGAVYWGFIGVMVWGAFHSDHRAALYSEEREVQKQTESVLKLVVKMVAVIATILLSFDVLKKRAKPEQHAIFATLGIAFFSGLVGLMSFSARKRGETVRRYRKIKGALLNLSIGMIAVAALLSFGFGSGGANGSASASVVMKQKGGSTTTAMFDDSVGSPEVEIIKAPQKQVIVEVPAPQITYTQAPQQDFGYYANNNQMPPPTFAPPQQQQPQQNFEMPQMVAPTVRQY